MKGIERFFLRLSIMKGIEVETPACLDLTRAAAFAIRIIAIAVLIWAIRWW